LVVCSRQGEDVEGVGGDYVGGEEVDLGWGVGDAVVVEVAFVGIAAVEDGAFDLDAEEVAPSVAVRSLRAGSLVGNRVGNSSFRAGYEEVVGCAVAAGTGQDYSLFGGAELEAEFGPFAAAFGVRDVGALAAIGHGGPLGEAVLRAILELVTGPQPMRWRLKSRFLAIRPLGMTKSLWAIKNAAFGAASQLF